MATREDQKEAKRKALMRSKTPQGQYDLRIRVKGPLHDAIVREAASEGMTKAGFVRACVVRILRARSH